MEAIRCRSFSGNSQDRRKQKKAEIETKRKEGFAHFKCPECGQIFFFTSHGKHRGRRWD